MTEKIIKLHGMITTCECLGYWGLATVLRQELERLKQFSSMLKK